MPLKNIIRLVQKLSLKNGSRHQSRTHEKGISQKDVPKDAYNLGNSSGARRLNIFEMLPRELILYVAQFLPLSSKVLFTLSCRAACTALGTSCWTNLRAKDQFQQHFEFLSQLSKDLPQDYVPCYHCRVLHLCTILYPELPPSWPSYKYRITACYEAELRGKLGRYTHGEFRFRTLQMAMKQYKLGLDYKLWLEFLCLKPTTYEIDQFATQYQVEVRIINGSLLFRSRRVILLPPGLKMHDLSRIDFYICPHSTIGTGGGDATVPETTGCSRKHRHDRQRWVRKSDLILCAECPTEHEFRLEECGPFGVAAIITKWMDLGEGQTILDPRWFSHLSYRYTTDVLKTLDLDNSRRVRGEIAVESNRGSIRDSFGKDKSSGSHPILPLETAKLLFRRHELAVCLAGARSRQST